MNKLVRIAYTMLGIKEVPGKKDNPQIVEFHKATGGGEAPDEVAWCSSFVNWVCKQAGIKGTGLKSARSWLTWGQKSETIEEGNILVFARGKPHQGHVCIAICDLGDKVVVIGGNQKNSVSVELKDKSTLLSVRKEA